MSVAEDTIPPPPLQTAPIVDRANRNPEVNFTGWTFTQAWAQWLLNVKVKLDVINAALYQLANIVGSGIPTRNPDGTWSTTSIEPGDTSIIVEDGDGVSGNPKIKINPLWAGQVTITTVGTITTGVWQGDVIANVYLDAAEKMTTTTTSAVGGAATALPALPVGYVTVNIAGTPRKIPYYD